MPEGPELHAASKFINNVCKNLVFGGKIIKSDVSKNHEISWLSEAFRITSVSRGKEIMLTLTDVIPEGSKNKKANHCIKILFHFGMSGVFKLTNIDDIPKHSHLRFFTIDAYPQQVLSFVDVRRFGGWQETSDWSKDRGPDPVYEYEAFRTNILSHLEDNAFNKPICEVLLNQSYFNGIGNYLRAEILFRAGIKPFEEARSVLPAQYSHTPKIEGRDLLQLCHDVPLEVITLDVASSYDPSATKEELMPFLKWLQVYDNPDMKKLRDHNKRTIWFSGEPGPLVPKNSENSSKKAHTNKKVPNLSKRKPDIDTSTINSKQEFGDNEVLKNVKVEKRKKFKNRKTSVYFSPRITRSKTRVCS